MGRSRMGKDTVAEILCDLIGREQTTVHRMSKTLKEAVCILYGYRMEDVEGPTKENIDPRYGITPRNAIQGLCDFLMKKHGANFFSQQVFQAYDLGAFHDRHVIIPDIRYEHDLAEIRNRGGIIVKIIRPYGLEVPCHAWEAHIDHIQGDYCIINQGSPEDLRKKIIQLFNQIVGNNAPLLPCLVKPQSSELVIVPSTSSDV